METKGNKPSLGWAILSLVLPVAMILYGTLVVGVRPPVLPLIGAVALAGLMGLKTGYRWEELQEGMFEALGRIQIAIAILALVGMIIAAWLASGTIPAIIYWGLKLIAPEHFLLSAMVLCSVASIATGTSFGTMGTIGVALLGVGQALGYPPALTITEKGYCIDPATGALDTSNPRIIHDLQTPEEPHSAPGILVEALKRRRERGLTPFTVLSCDNIPDNGHVVKNAVLGMAEKRSPELAGWIKEHVSFPGTMVDRIVPAATDESLVEISQHLGVNDPCAISCEPFIQWVVEDNFVAGRPAWEVAGVQMVNDVLPWEEMKLRMLNGSHSFLAYLGYLSGFAHISDCMQDRAFRHAARTLMLDEQAPTLQIKDVDLTQYADKLIARFANPALKHKTWQIAMDGSQKLPQRMLAGIRIHLGRETDWSLLALGVAGWMRYVSGVDDAGNAIDVRDPLSDKIRELVAGSSSEQRVTALLSLREVFGDDLPDNPHFVQAIEQAWQQIVQFGAHQALLNTLKI